MHNYLIIATLGNELSGNGIGASVAVDQYSSDTIDLQNIVQDVYRDFQVKPAVLGPGGFFDAGWFSKFINETSNSLQVITHHIYNLGPGICISSLICQMEPKFSFAMLFPLCSFCSFNTRTILN